MQTDNDADRLAALYPEDVPQPETGSTASATPKKSEQAEANDAAALHYPNDQPKTEGGGQAEPLFGPPPSEYSLTMPEGLVMTQDIQREVAPVFRELNLSSAGVNKLMPHVAKFRDRIVNGQIEAHHTIAKEWAREAKADPDIGGGNWGETQAMLKVALNAAGNDPEFLELFEQSKLGNHPAFVRAFRNLGRRLKGR